MGEGDVMAEPTMMTDEELFGATAEPSPPKGAPHSSPMMMTDEELFGSAKPGALSRSSDEGWLSGAAKGAATGVLKGVANIPGFAGNLRALGDVASGYVLGEKPEELRRKREAHSLLPSLLPEKWLPTGAEIAAPVLEKTGEYKPESTVGKIGQAAVEGAVSGLGPGFGSVRGSGLAPAPSFGKQWLPRSPSIAPRDVGSAAFETVKQAPLNALSSGAAEGVYDTTHHAGLALLAGIAAPGATEGVVRGGLNVTRPMRPSQHEAMAAEHLEGMMHDPAAVRETLWPEKGPTQDFVLKDSQPTLGQLTGDVGLLEGERNAINKDNSAFNINETKRNTTRLNALRSIEPNADPRDVAKTVSDYHNALENNLSALEAKLTKEAQEKADKLGPAANPEVIGADLRNAIEAERMKVKDEVSRLYGLVDPEGKMALVSRPISAHARETIENVGRLAEPLTEDVKRVFDQAASVKDVEKLKDVIDLDKNINSALRKEQIKSPGSDNVRLLSNLKSEVRGAIDKAVENQHAYEQQAVARGEMAPEDTFYARLLRDRNNFLEARRDSKLAAEGTNTGRPGTASGVLGSAGASSARSRSNRGFEGGQTEGGLEPTFDEGASDRYKAATAGHRDYSRVYKEGPVGESLRNTGSSGQYRIPSSGIPSKAFVPGDRGYQTADAFLRAANISPDAVTAMQEAALNALRKTAVKDGVISPAKLAAWKANHAPALRALDEQVPGFSKSFDDAAKATDKLVEFAARQKKMKDDFKESAFGKFVGLKEPDEIQNAVGSMLTAQKGAVANVRQMVKGMPPDAVEGMRKAAVDWIVRTMTNAAEAGGSEEKKLSYAKIDSLIKNRGSALSELFTPEQMNTLRAVQRDMELSDRTRQAALNPTNPSGSAKNMQASLEALSKQIKETSLLMAMWGEFSNARKEGWTSTLTVGIPAAALAGVTHYNAVGAGKVAALTREALQNPAVARQLLMKVPPKQVKNRFDVLSSSVRRGLLSSMQNDEVSERPERPRRASGGRTVAPKPQTAQSLLAAVKRARKAIQSQTEAILAQPDEHVVRALSVANEKI
jgi:hypothetical protein